VRALIELVERVVDTDATLLVTGETGVGKEWLAKAVHGASQRARGPFVAVNCAAIPAALLESELFGHERGAFTGAIRTRRGCFEVAHGGTLLLDEIGDMPMLMQAKLLRVLQEREIQPIGSEDVIRVDVRVLAATNSDLSEAVGNGSFRSDLYYRLGVVELALPPLRERFEDLPELVARYARDIGIARRGVPFRVTAASLAKMAAYRWPGNLRELANVIERAILLAKSDVLVAADLAIDVDVDVEVDPPTAARAAAAEGSSDVGALDLTSVRRSAADRAEREYLAAHLHASRGRIGETAERAGVSTRALRTRMRRFGLRKEDFRAAKRGE
jgi:transcriptional regulator with GAF, ATPase, and Fis domain